MLWFDAHNHLLDARFTAAPAELLATMRAAGIEGCVANAQCEADWHELAALAARHRQVVPAYGIHPWRAASVRDGWTERLHARLLADPRASVGECGLDRWVAEPSLEVQRPVCQAQLELAAALDRPVTIHCLRAWNELFELFERLPVMPRRLLIHAFSASLEVAARLLGYGAYLSFNGYLLHPRKAKACAVFAELPPERIMLESDAPDMLPPCQYAPYSDAAGPHYPATNHPANLAAVGRECLRRFGWSVDQLLSTSRHFWQLP